MFNFFKIVFRALKIEGGLLKALIKTLNIYKNFGLVGLRRSFKYFISNGRINPIDGSGKFDRNDYSEWIHRYDFLSNQKLRAMKSKLDDMNEFPLISIVMPTYNSNINWLKQAIDSVKAQIYPHWELCIADDASTNNYIHKFLKEAANKDKRIKLKIRNKNGHISRASNSAIKLAQGQWIALLDHDDLISEDALFLVAKTIIENNSAALIYSDEDKIDENNIRSGPYFKPDWNYELFLSHNLITHLGVYRKDIVDKIGGFREGFEGAQDYDLALRFIDCINPTDIIHIPKVLYHWRIHDKSTAKNPDAKPYAMIAGERAINDRFKRLKIDAKAEYINFGYKVTYAIPKKPPLVSIIIPTKNQYKLTKQCIESILNKTDYENYEIILVNNNSDDFESIQYFNEIQSHPKVRVLKDSRPFNYSELNNTAVNFAKGEYIALLNNDTKIISSIWLSEMLSYSIQPGVGVVGAKLLYPNGTLQHGGIILGIGGWAGHSHRFFEESPGYIGRMALVSNFSAVTGACMLTSKKIYKELGGLNSNQLKVACNDVDFCLKSLRKGYRNVFTPYAELYHYESATRGQEDSPEKKRRFKKEVDYMRMHYPEFFENDPAYNPNLTLSAEDFSLSWPPRNFF